MNDDATGNDRFSAEELARLRRIEEAAREVLHQMQGRRSASPMLAAIAKLRAGLKEEDPEAGDSPSG
jgi:hypothetical protein